MDILVNNAGCAFTMQDPTPFSEQAQQSIDINYYGTKHMIETFLPLCNRNASFIGVSSTSGQLEGDFQNLRIIDGHFKTTSGLFMPIT